MSVFFPKLRALWLAENTTHAQRDRLGQRGAEVRDGLSWSRFLSETIEAYGPHIDAEFASHHWPLWGNARILEFLEKQRDLSRFIHDQSVRLLNQGYLAGEIVELIQLPPELDLPWYDRDYYGGVKAAVRAVYRRYLGDREVSPSALDPLPPAAAARKYVEYMGGASAVVDRARADFERGEYRWVAEALQRVVSSDPNDQAAKSLLADALEQLGYQSESVAWRAEYLQGARELRQGPPAPALAAPTPALTPAGADSAGALPLEQLFITWAVRLDAQKAAGKRLSLVFSFPDLEQQWALTLQNSVLTASRRVPPYPDATVTLSRAAFDALSRGEASAERAIASGQWAVTGRAEALTELLAMLDTSSSAVDLVTP
jgi:alkyl sulfatase BDS1-like metallo-beta-lactamase superfamily hydrolase